MAGAFYDPLESREPEAREADLFRRLRAQIAHAKANAPRLAALYVEVDPEAVTDRAALARLPVLRKAELPGLQTADPPFGGLLAVDPGALSRVFLSPGPIHEPEGRRPDYWRMARALYAAGFRAGELIHNAFAYHLTPAGAMIEGGALALGCPVFAAGVGNTEQQLGALAAFRPAGFTGTPSFLKTLLERAGGPTSLTKALVSGEPLPAALRDEIAALGVAASQCYAIADLGLIAYETPAREGLVVDEEVIVEIVAPGTGDPVPEGAIGEVLVTTLAPEYPLIRFATGDLSATLPGPSPCGRTNMRLKGWLGRADQATKVKGMFVYPQQIAEVVRRHPEIGRARLVVERDGGRDRMTLACEVAAPAAGLAEAIAATLAAVTKLRGEVALVAPGSLPEDGKAIDDRRDLV